MSKKITRVVVVGGGFGGVKSALLLSGQAGFDVTLISDNTRFEYHGALYRSAVGRSPMEVVIPLKDIFEGTDVRIELDKAAYIDNQKKSLVSETGNIYKYDVLILALGNTVNYFNLKGMDIHAERMNDISSTIKLRKKLVEIFSVKSKKPARVAIIGAGASGVELAGEVYGFAKLVAKRHGANLIKPKVMLIDGSDRILPLLSKKASDKTTKHLQKQGVQLHLNTRVESCEEGNVCLSVGNLGADVVVWTAGSKPVDFYQRNDHIFTIGRGGRVVVDDYLRSTGQKDIYVLGDNADTKYSGMAQTALWDAMFVVKNLVSQRSGKKMKPYRAKKPIYVVTAGQKWAVAEKGRSVVSGKRGWAVRRQADLAIFKNFQPYKEAIKTWRNASKYADF